MYRRLVALGLDPAAVAEVAANTRRWWKNAAGTGVNIALPTSYFDALGVPRLAS